MSHGSHNVEAVNSDNHVTVQRTHMSEGNVVGPLIDQIGPPIADEAIDHTKWYQDLKQNLPLVHPPTVTGESWERKQKEKFKLKTKQNSLGHTKRPIRAVLKRLEQGHQP